MLLPKEKLQMTKTYQGKESKDGWLVLDFTKIDTDGLTKIYIDLSDIEWLKQHQGRQENIMKRTLDLLSGDNE